MGGVAGNERATVPETRRPLDLTHGVGDVDEWDHGGPEVALGPLHERVEQPVVVRARRGNRDLRSLDEEAPQADRREEQLGPDALLVEVGHPGRRVVGTGRPHAILETGRLVADGPIVDVDHLVLSSAPGLPLRLGRAVAK